MYSGRCIAVKLPAGSVIAPNLMKKLLVTTGRAAVAPVTVRSARRGFIRPQRMRASLARRVPATSRTCIGCQSILDGELGQFRDWTSEISQRAPRKHRSSVMRAPFESLCRAKSGFLT